MGIFSKLFGKEERPDPCSDSSIEVADVQSEEILDALDLGWYWSDNKNEYQMAKIAEGDRATHMYVIGATGSGKTKFLEHLIRQDIEKGNGFAVIDPHGDLVEDIKGFLACRYKVDGILETITKNLILVDPTDPNHTVTFNPLEKLPNVSVSEQVNELVSAFRKIWSDSWGVRMEDLMRNSLMALGEADLTLADLPGFLTKRTFRQFILQSISHLGVHQYFERFDAMTDRGQSPWIEPVMNKINSFFADERIRQMFASSTKSSFNLREIMDQQKILLIKLDKGRLKDAADLLGSLLMAKIQMVAFSRADIPQNRRIPFYLYIDEFQNFASESFEVILSEARKYGLSLIMAHQTTAQISNELRSLILGNAGIQVYFRVNRQDASLLAKEAFSYSGFEIKTVSSMRPVFWSYSEEWEHKIEELQSLPPRSCYAKHKIEGGMIQFETADIKPGWQALEMRENEFSDYLKTVPFGKNYLMPRNELNIAAEKRREAIAEEIDKRREQERKVHLPQPAVAKAIPIEKEEPPPAKKEKRVRADIPIFEGQGGSQHRYLQSLIKRMAEEKGFRAIIERATPDGAGFVDVSIERDGRKIACEISLTTSDDHEFDNIGKCLAAGYDQVVLCSPDKKALEKAKAFVLERLSDLAKGKIFFFQPEELFFFLEQEAAKSGNKEERVKGYKVKVRYQPVKDTDKKMKRDAVGQVIAQALRRLKGSNKN